MHFNTFRGIAFLKGNYRFQSTRFQAYMPKNSIIRQIPNITVSLVLIVVGYPDICMHTRVGALNNLEYNYLHTDISSIYTESLSPPGDLDKV